MALRIHSYSANPDYDFGFEYYRDADWTSLKNKVVSSEPINVRRSYREITTADLVLDNQDGLLTPENKDSAYNIGQLGTVYATGTTGSGSNAVTWTATAPGNDMNGFAVNIETGLGTSPRSAGRVGDVVTIYPARTGGVIDDTETANEIAIYINTFPLLAGVTGAGAGDGVVEPDGCTLAGGESIPRYDPLLDEARKVRLTQGINCWSNIAHGIVPSANVAPTGGWLDKLTDMYAGDLPTPQNGSWTYWSAVASGDPVILTIDLAESKRVQHGGIQFLSKSNESPQIMLPSSVYFEYSVNGSDWFPASNDGLQFKMRPGTYVADEDSAEYTDSITGMAYLAWFTDLDTDARYVRATITNIAETNEIYIDEFSVYGGATIAFVGVKTITGYLGDSIDCYAQEGKIEVAFEDVRKKESDNRRVELTMLYQNKRPEEIIYDLLTNRRYWGDTLNLITNPSFELPGSYGPPSGWVDGGIVTSSQLPYSGNWKGHMDYPGQYTQQDNIQAVAGKTYTIEVWFYAKSGGSGLWIEIQPYNDSTPLALTRYPVGSGSVAGTSAHQLITLQWTAPATTNNCSLKIALDCPNHAYTSQNDGIDDVAFYETLDAVSEYGAPVSASEIGWVANANLSNFTITGEDSTTAQWQGQQGTILDYCNELAELIGWVYDADGDGVRQFWGPEQNRTTPHPHLYYFGNRWGKRGTAHRVRTGKDIRNCIKLVGYESANKEVPRVYRHDASITRYGLRYGRITEPLIRSAAASDYLGKALLRDYAWAGNSLDVSTIGDFDVDQAYRIASFHESIRTMLDKTELWAIWSHETQMITAGKGQYDASISAKKYASSMPNPIASIACAGASGQVTVSWAAAPEVDADGYYVYRAVGDNPATWVFTKSAKVSAGTETLAVTGLTNATAYWFYVTSINQGGVESEHSAIVRCLAGAGASGSEETTWGIADLVATIADNDPEVSLDLSWTPDIVVHPDYAIYDMFGPYDSAEPTIAASHAKIEIADGAARHWYRSYQKLSITAGVAFYWRIALREIVISDVHYKFGTPLYSNADSEVWPT